MMTPRRCFLTSLLLIYVLTVPAVLADGESCVDNAECGTNEYCEFLYGSCLFDEPIGRCRYVPPNAGCPHLYMPVCGCDLQTYTNACWADVAYVSLLYLGECQICGSAGGSCGSERVCQVAEECTPQYEGVCVPTEGPQLRTFVFEGTVDSLFDGLGLVAGVSPGDRFHGSLIYDLTTPNTGGVGQGEFGRYLHPSAPSGVRLVLGDLTVRSVSAQPELTVLVNNDVGFAGADEYGFDSGNSELAASPFSPGVLALDLSWLLSELVGNPIANVDLPVCPVDPTAFTSNVLSLFVDCVPCLGPASFLEATGSIDVLETDLILRVDRDGLHWNWPSGAIAFDVLVGNLFELGDFAQATTACLQDDLAANSFDASQNPASGEGWWFLVRSERLPGAGSWDSSGLRQQHPRDRGIQASGAGCS